MTAGTIGIEVFIRERAAWIVGAVLTLGVAILVANGTIGISTPESLIRFD